MAQIIYPVAETLMKPNTAKPAAGGQAEAKEQSLYEQRASEESRAAYEKLAEKPSAQPAAESVPLPAALPLISADTLAHSVVMAEVLGKPVALRRGRGRGGI